MANSNRQQPTPPRDTRGSQSVTTAVISTVATRADTDPVDMDPLYSVVDTDALNALFQPGAEGQVAFTYNGYEIVAHSDGEVNVSPVDE